ncbi:MAG: alanine racemase [Rhodocyclaceae bacterium]|nr:alanine racemase [Rhodocyclaceae bacterium]
MSRPIRALIHPEALRHNFSVVRRHAGEASLWAVVKAYGYGHGLSRVAHPLSGLADGFALLELAEAQTLRQEGLNHPILLLEGYFSPDELQKVAALGLTPVIHSRRQLQWLEEARLPVPIRIYLKINTGMNRLGFVPAEVPEVLAGLRRLTQVAGITLMSHFAEADGGRGVAWQLERFRSAHAGTGLPMSLANSAALMNHPETVGGRGDWGRTGIAVYGSSPFPEARTALELDLWPAMTLLSEVIAVQELRPGERVGYGGLFQAQQPMRIGIVACGYADGYPRHAPTGTPIACAGRRTRTLGRVSMDMLMLDLTDIPAAGIGAPVVLWGGEGAQHVPVDEVATAAGTIAYELFCALAPRVPVLTA